MKFKQARDLHIRVTTEETYHGMDNLDLMVVEVFDRHEKYQIEHEYEGESDEVATPLATVVVQRIVGNNPAYIVDTADATDGGFYSAANAILGHEDDPIRYEYLTALLGFSYAHSDEVSALFYIDQVHLREDLTSNQLSMILSASISKITKGMEKDSWIAVSYAQKTAFMGSLSRFYEEDKPVYSHAGKESMIKALKDCGFKSVLTKEEEKIEQNPILAVASGTLKLEFEPKKIQKLKV